MLIHFRLFYDYLATTLIKQTCRFKKQGENQLVKENLKLLMSVWRHCQKINYPLHPTLEAFFKGKTIDEKDLPSLWELANWRTEWNRERARQRKMEVDQAEGLDKRKAK